jgi:GTP-binding protein EngB required for normal cell division
MADVSLIATLEDLVTRYGLIEFRSALATILETLERRGLELAVFGRVSTGKSSLLNRLLEREVLPVGVTPITAVPTRIGFGPEPRLRVWFADAPSRELDVSVLEEYASERENPANIKRVLHLVLELPTPLIGSGITLVDTPGLGSLATAGAAETLAYLPRCDVAVLLIDASSTMTSEDFATLGLLLDAGIRVSVLPSKADLLAGRDRDAALAYISQMLAREFTSPIAVAAVSVRPELDALFQHWREAELAPVIADQERERQKAAARKTEILRSQVEAILKRWPTAEPRASAGDAVGESRAADEMLQTAAGQITVLEQRINENTLVLTRRAPEIITRAAEFIQQRLDPQRALRRPFVT